MAILGSVKWLILNHENTLVSELWGLDTSEGIPPS